MSIQTSVLLVGGNEADANLIAEVLSLSKRFQFELSRVPTIAAAHEQLRGRRYEAVLIDLAMPKSEETSFDFIQSHSSAAVVIGLVDEDREEEGRRAVESGAYEFVFKSERGCALLPLTIAHGCEQRWRHQQERELLALLANAADAIASVDASGTCTAVNPAFAGLLEYSPAEVEGRLLLDLVHESEREQVEHALRSKGTEQLEARAIGKNGRIVPVRVSVVPRGDGRGHFCFARDLMQRQLADGKLASSAAITAVGALAMGLAHEINNPLAAVLTNVEEAVRVTYDIEPSVATVAKSDFLDLRAMLEEALAASQRVQFTVRDLRPFACAEERRGRLDLNVLIESCCNIAFAEIRHRARLVKDLKATVPVLGSEVKLAQVFFNLLVNAAHAMPEGDVERNEIHISTAQRGRGTIVVEVSDTGFGIAQANVERAFEPFFTTKPRRPGMGLAICKATVVAHGGEISIHPVEGGGTVVRIVLPTQEVDAAEDEQAAPGGRAEPADAGTPMRRVLVVDDDPHVLRSLTRVLARDFEVAAARNGREALDLVRAGGQFDAMLCDLMMPELSGIELHAQLQQDDPELAKRTVFITGGAVSGSMQSYLESAGRPYLQKPADPNTIRAHLMDVSHPPRERVNSKWLGGG